MIHVSPRPIFTRKNIILLSIGKGDSRSLSLKPSNGVIDPANAPNVVVEPKETQGIQYKLRGNITGFYFQIIYITYLRVLYLPEKISYCYQ